jgi:hypothetical protein
VDPPAEAWYFAYTMDDKRKLKGMLARIFSDAVADAAERAELKAYLSTGPLTMREIKEVFDDFVETTWIITMADGVVSPTERRRMIEIVDVLGVELDSLPPSWARLLTDPLPEDPLPN